MGDHPPRMMIQSQLSIQPNVPTDLLASASNPDSGASKAAAVHIINQKYPHFPTKKFRMRSLLWVKPPQGEAVSTTSSTFAQLVPTIMVNVASLSVGISLGFSAIVLPQLRAVSQARGGPVARHHLNQPFTADPGMGSWIASVFGLGAMLAALMWPLLSTKFGHRRHLLMMTVPDLLGWILIAASRNSAMMLIGRMLCGFAAAGYAPSVQAYVSQMAQPQHRAWLCGLSMPITAFGTLLAYLCGAGVTWQYVAVMGGVCPVILVPCLAYLSDSPLWFMQKGDDKKAIEVLTKFRSTDANAFSELLAISDSLKATEQKASWLEGFRQMGQCQNRRPFLMLNLLFLMVAFSGHAVITFYAVDIFRRATKQIDPSLSAVFMGVIHFLGSLFCLPAVRRCSHKMLICVSAVVMSLALVVCGIGLHANQMGGSARLWFDLNFWLPHLCIMLYMLAAPMGMTAVPFLLPEQFYSAHMMPILQSLSSALCHLEVFVAVKTFPSLSKAIGASGAVWVYGCVCLVCMVYTLAVLPESQGKTSQDLNTYFSQKRQLHVKPLPAAGHLDTIDEENNIYPLSIQFTL